MAEIEHGKDIPSADSVATIEAIKIFDVDGNAIQFKDLLKDSEKTLLVFIRHFYCGNCQAYVSALSKSITTEELAAAGASIKVIGHGSAEVIKAFNKITGSSYPVYTEPTYALHKALQLKSNLSSNPNRPKYMENVGMFSSAMKGALQHLQYGVTKGGDIRQNGGEFLVTREGEWKWGWIMRYTDDHTDVPEVRKVLGL